MATQPNNRRRGAAPAPKPETEQPQVQPPVQGEPTNDTDPSPDIFRQGLGTRKSMFATVGTNEKRDKVVALQETRQQLAEAKDLYSEGEEKADEASSVANKAAQGLYSALIAGTISEDEASAVLGDVFQFKGTGEHKKKTFPAGHPNAGKTPAGQGNFIRMRVFRMARAKAYADGGEGDKFFSPIARDDVGLIVLQMEEGERTTWNAYSALQDLKRAATERTEAAFDPKKVLAIVAALSEDGSAAKVHASIPLRESYRQLITLLLSPAFDEPEGEGEE